MPTGYGRFDPGYLMTALLNRLGPLPGPLYVGLAGTNPLAGDPLAAELSYPHYTRREMGIGLIAANILENTNDIAFHGVPTRTTVAGVVVFDTRELGNFIAGYVFDPPDLLDAGGVYKIPAAFLQLGIDVAEV